VCGCVCVCVRLCVCVLCACVCIFCYFVGCGLKGRWGGSTPRHARLRCFKEIACERERGRGEEGWRKGEKEEVSIERVRDRHRAKEEERMCVC